MKQSNFEWDPKKNLENLHKHGVSFEFAQHAFSDMYRVIAEDVDHSQKEPRHFCFGKIDNDILTVRIGAGY